ncbi:MAG TPA: UPF0175 family protein [Bryobacteraceae bacterium]|nr:UPF0175 family protein [Bryobacteraceae bacterium]
MQITFQIPDDLASAVAAGGQEVGPAAVEALALEAYRSRRITGYQLRRLLDIPSRYELDAFLKRHQVYDYTDEDFEKDLAGIQEFRERQKTAHPA